MIKIFKYLESKDWIKIFVGVIFIIAQVWLDLKLPDYMAEITQLIQTPGSDIKEVWRAGGFMLLCALGSFVAAIIVGFFAAKVAASLSRSLRSSMFHKVGDFSLTEISGFSTASLITRSTNDINQVQMIVAMGLQVMIKAPILATWAIIKISNKSWQWTTATAVAVGVLLLMVTVIVVFALPKFKIIQSLTDNLNRITRENLTGLRVVRAYNAENYQEEKFLQANNELTETQLFTSRMMAIIMPAITIIMSGLSLSIYWLGASIINQAQLMDRVVLFSDMVVFSSYAMQIVFAFMMLAMIFIMLPRAAVSAKRINEVLDSKSSIIEGEILQGDANLKGEVEFKNVSFRFPDADEAVLKNINFKAKQGQTVAFIGSTGSGKSTLINLIPRFYDVTEGEILIDGVNIKDYKMEVLHNKLGYVPQKAVLFSGTVQSNVAFGDNGKGDYSLEQVKKAIEIAQAEDFVLNMENQYQGLIAQAGANISGGQKQRLSIARAVCRQPEIYIFDDSFSALDYQTDRKLRSVLKQETKNVTSFIVAQRIGTIKDADQIVVLDEGEIVGIGTHKELLKTCLVYQEIAYSQLSKEELENG